MIKLMLSEVVEALRGQVRSEVPAVSVSGVSTDSRTLSPGDLFFALRGPNFDGHDFVSAAVERGAVAAVVDARQAPLVAKELARPLLLIAVDDVLAALGLLANYHRRQHPANVIAVVGSNGKTTTKAMIDHILAGSQRGRCSPKSFNNSIGVPLTLLTAGHGDDYLVVEIGTNAPGEIAQLASLAEPNMAVITCIGEEHLEKLGDLDGVAAEECSVLAHLRSGGFAALNLDEPAIRRFLPENGPRYATFGACEDADLRITACRYDAPWLAFSINGRFDYRLHMPGAHNASNAAGAIAVALRVGLSHEAVAARLESFVPPPMRGELLRLGGVTVVNDAYNANPHSALSALSLLESVAKGGRRIVVFGEMKELGPRSFELHGSVARRLREERVDHVVLVGRAGDLMYDALRGGDLFSPSVERVDSVEACAARLLSLLRDGDAVLLKASRAVGLERVLDVLTTHRTEPAAA
jgi:UDP-N-acetylmuramoyl-tripeptide--D-alanyl-D-alanine ligase